MFCYSSLYTSHTLFLFCREKFHIGKNCRFHCSWKLVALSLTALTLVLSSVIVYFGGKKELTTRAEPELESDRNLYLLKYSAEYLTEYSAETE